jgi:hypothetical protein
MSPAERLLMAHRVAGQAVADMVCADNALTPREATRLLARSVLANVRMYEGEGAAELLYREADALVGTR